MQTHQIAAELLLWWQQITVREQRAGLDTKPFVPRGTKFSDGRLCVSATNAEPPHKLETLSMHLERVDDQLNNSNQNVV